MGDKIATTTVELTATDGISTIEKDAPLTRLHYFDGKFLRADALTLEQDYHRTLVRLSNLGGGWGAVHGLGITTDGGTLGVSPGLAFSQAGSTILLTQAINVEIAKLIAAATPSPPEAPVTGVASSRFAECVDAAPAGAVETPGTDYYEITVGPFARMCGSEEVYGKLCEEACVTDTQRPYWREGMILRLRPITLALPGSTSVPLGAVHLRNQVASAYFACEPWLWPSLLSNQGLHSGVWCNPAMLRTRDEVPIGILVRSGATTRFIDAWSARRERMDTQAKGYWQGRMMMRPWNVFIAQILQFQCQLSGLFQPDSPQFTPVDDECGRLRTVLDQSVRQLRVLRTMYADSQDKIQQMLAGIPDEFRKTLSAIGDSRQGLDDLTTTLVDFQDSLPTYAPNRMLLNGGFVELPSAGYLPVVPGKQPINTQMQRMFGEGVNLHFCTARPDYIPHAVEQAQHMERISLTRGLDDPTRKEEVEIFVPDGEIVGIEQTQDGNAWFIDLAPAVVDAFTNSIGVVEVNPAAEPQIVKMARRGNVAEVNVATDASATLPLTLTGIARTTRLEQGGAALTLVCQVANDNRILTNQLTKASSAQSRQAMVAALYVDLRINGDPFAAQEGDELPISVELRNLEAIPVTGADNSTSLSRQGVVSTGNGTLTIGSSYPVDTGIVGMVATAQMRIGVNAFSYPDGVPISPAPPDLSVNVGLRLQRKGGADDGTLLIFPMGGAQLRETVRAVAAGLTWAAQWGSAPRTAVFGVLDTQTQQTSNKFWMPGVPLGGLAEKAGLGAVPPALSELGRIDTSSASDLPLIPLVRMRQAEGALAPENPMRLTALNTLQLIADATVDQPFLARARRRLFPDTAAPAAGINVRATRDWVMFRRQRKAICEAAAQPAPPQKLQSFQTWHLQFKDVDALAKLISALDSPNTVKLSNAERVDVLHFAETSATPAENVVQILQAWKDIQPVGEVAVALIWERAPVSVPNSLDVARLKGLTDVLQGLIPTTARTVIESLATAPSGLDDTEFDGGMLLVTVPRPVVLEWVHRVFFLPDAIRAKVQAMIDDGQKDVPQQLTKMDSPFMDVHFHNATADNADLLQIRAFAQPSLSLNLTEATLLAATPSAGTAQTTKTVAEDQYRIIHDFIPLPDQPHTTSQVDAPDFGTGAIAATLLFFEKPVAPAEQELVHRVFFIKESNREGTIQRIKAVQSGTDPAALLGFLEEAGRPNAVVHFTRATSEPKPDDIKNLLASRDTIKNILTTSSFLLATKSPDQKQAIPENAVIAKSLGIDAAKERAEVPVADFGEGAFAATLDFYRSAVDLRAPRKRPAKPHG